MKPINLRELAFDCYSDVNNDFDSNAFAELVINECANWVNDYVQYMSPAARQDLQKHFGIEK